LIFKYRYLFFFLIVLINVLVKSLYAYFPSYSFDESISIKNCFIYLGHIKHESEWDNNPPFYYYCFWVWHKLIPINEFNSRFLSILFTSFAIGLSFLFANKYFNRTTAFYTAILLSLSNFLVYYSLEARAYALVLLLALVSSWQFFKYLNASTWQNLLVLSLINFLLIYTHYISGIILLTQFAFIALYQKKQVKFFFLFQTAVLVGLVLLRFTKKQWLNILGFNSKGDFWLKTATSNDLFNAIENLFYNRFTAVFFLIVLISFIFSYFRNKEVTESKIEFYCLFLGFFSILFLYGVGTQKALFLDRYLIFCIPFAVMLISFQLSKNKLVGKIIFALVVLFQIFSYDLKKESDMDYRSAAQIIKKLKTPHDYVIINTRDNLGLFEYYFDRSKYIKFRNIDSLSRTQNIFGVNSVESLKNIDFKRGSTLFLVQSFHKISRSDNPIQNFLADSAHRGFHTNTINGIELSVFVKNKF
jgi:uncharacterized membrane protein